MVTVRPESGVVSPVPWISAMLTVLAVGAAVGSVVGWAVGCAVGSDVGSGAGVVPEATGVGAPAVKSAALSSVSVPAARWSDSAALVAAVAAAPS
ncbi:hypothetical protein AXF14_06370 [Actinomyces radicidentis]|uniref:Uncharacterized protein n=1 Tax=Actinomyces radicidentis TaxID=111015 RepID=A0A0X8JER0_ACTRD|nr:hypothetical protein AXF14_06370 [Actinomyces radicidentis]